MFFRKLDAGTTYYIWATKYNENKNVHYDLCINYGEPPRMIIDGVTLQQTDYTIPSGENPNIVLDLTQPEEIECRYQWYRYSYIDSQYEVIPGATSSTLTAGSLGDSFRCRMMLQNTRVTYDFYIVREDYLPVSSPSVINVLSDPGQQLTIPAPSVSGAREQVSFLVFPDYSGWYNNLYDSKYMGGSRRWDSSSSLTVPTYNNTIIDYIQGTERYFSLDLENDFIEEDGIFTFYIGFVRSGTNVSSISAGENKTVTLYRVEREESDYYGFEDGYMTPECTIYSFTPGTSGTYTLRSSDINIGDPYGALFDSNNTCLAYSDNTDGTFFFNNRYSDDPATEDYNFSITQHLNAGQTYYFVVWAAPVRTRNYDSDDIFAEYNVSVTCDAPDRTVRVSSGGHGTASASVTSGPSGTQVTLTATPENGYRFTSWQVVSGGVSISNNSFAIGNSDVEIRANFEQIPVTPPPQSTGTTEGGVAGFVERLYTIALGRASDPTGKQNWIDAITQRGETGAGAARGFLFSPEFLNRQCSNEEFVSILYRTFFNREPDQGGFNAWVNALNNGASKQEVIEGFINSTEWANLCVFYGIRSGSTATPTTNVEPNAQTIAFATRLYTTCLGRNADQAGLMAWARQLANQRDTGSGAALGFFFSNEFTGQNVSNGEFVTRLYRTFMDREPDQAGFDAWVAQLDSGVSREEVFNGFAQSSEFDRICSSYGIIR